MYRVISAFFSGFSTEKPGDTPVNNGKSGPE
jgi:hypothetical protein